MRAPNTYFDLCSECLAEQQQAVRDASLRKEQALEAAKQQMFAAVQRLRSLGSPGLMDRRMARGSRRRMFRLETTYDVLMPAWPVGSLEWDFPETGRSGGGVEAVPSGVTEAGEFVPMTIAFAGENPVEYAQGGSSWDRDTGIRPVRRTAEDYLRAAQALEAITGRR